MQSSFEQADSSLLGIVRDFFLERCEMMGDSSCFVRKLSHEQAIEVVETWASLIANIIGRETSLIERLEKVKTSKAYCSASDDKFAKDVALINAFSDFD